MFCAGRWLDGGKVIITWTTCGEISSAMFFVCLGFWPNFNRAVVSLLRGGSFLSRDVSRVDGEEAVTWHQHAFMSKRDCPESLTVRRNHGNHLRRGTRAVRNEGENPPTIYVRKHFTWLNFRAFGQCDSYSSFHAYRAEQPLNSDLFSAQRCCLASRQRLCSPCPPRE